MLEGLVLGWVLGTGGIAGGLWLGELLRRRSGEFPEPPNLGAGPAGSGAPTPVTETPPVLSDLPPSGPAPLHTSAEGLPPGTSEATVARGIEDLARQYREMGLPPMSQDEARRTVLAHMNLEEV